MLNPDKVRKDFPILEKKLRGRPVIYFDSACVALKPKQVIGAMDSYYTDFTACHGRSIHDWSKRTTEEFEGARARIARFINAKKEECVFTRNTTEGINLVAHSIGLARGDKVVTTNLEHNSNLVPWMYLSKKTGIRHEMTLVDKEGEFDVEDFKKRLDKNTKLVSVIHSSNVMGTTMPAKEISEMAHDNGSLVMFDCAQSAPHRRLDVRDMGADFIAFSCHKMLGPSGTGVLYGRKHLLETMGPFLVGGETVKDVDAKGYVLEEPPAKFEAGLQNYSGAIGAGAAAEYLMGIGMDNVEKYEHELAKELLAGFERFSHSTVYGPRDYRRRGALVAFSLDHMNPHEVALMLSERNIFVRSGMHCVHAYHKGFLGAKDGTVRPSLYIYNTKEEIAEFFGELEKIAALA